MSERAAPHLGHSKHGRSASDICEGEAGCTFHKAIIVEELRSAAYAAGEEFGYDEDNPVAVEFSRLCREIESFAADLSITEDGELTHERQCARCSGDGKTHGEDPCVECGGKGSVHAEEANG